MKKGPDTAQSIAETLANSEPYEYRGKQARCIYCGAGFHRAHFDSCLWYRANRLIARMKAGM